VARLRRGRTASRKFKLVVLFTAVAMLALPIAEASANFYWG
jgi:hypothetical protein